MMERGSVIDAHQEFLNYAPFTIKAIRMVIHKKSLLRVAKGFMGGGVDTFRNNREDEVNRKINREHQTKLLDLQRDLDSAAEYHKLRRNLDVNFGVKVIKPHV